MSLAFVIRLQIVAIIVAAVGLLFGAGVAAPGHASAAGQATCSLHRLASGDPATIRVRCTGDRPSPARSLGTSFRRSGANCRIEHLGALDPAAYRYVC